MELYLWQTTPSVIRLPLPNFSTLSGPDPGPDQALQTKFLFSLFFLIFSDIISFFCPPLVTMPVMATLNWKVAQAIGAQGEGSSGI